jgi:lipopolysaccharide export system permease protein
MENLRQSLMQRLKDQLSRLYRLDRLERYVFNQVLLMVGLVLSVFIGIYIVFAFVGDMHNFNKNYGFLLAILTVVFSIPTNLIFILPISALLGTLIGLGNLASHSELTAMRAAGFSMTKIAIAVLKAGFLIAILSFVMSAFLGPFFSKEALNLELGTKKSGSFLLTPNATWLKDGSDFVYIGRSTGEDYLHGVVKYHFEDGNLVSIISANSAIYQDGGWHLFGLNQVDLSPKGVSQKHTAEAIWPELVPPNLLKAVSADISNLNLIQLYRYLSYRKLNGLDPRQYALKVWQIYAQPLSILVLMLISVPFAFGQLRSSTVGLRLVIGIALGIAFFLLDRFFGPIVLVLNWPPFWGAFLPDLIFLLGSAVFFWRIR